MNKTSLRCNEEKPEEKKLFLLIDYSKCKAELSGDEDCKEGDGDGGDDDSCSFHGCSSSSIGLIHGQVSGKGRRHSSSCLMGCTDTDTDTDDEGDDNSLWSNQTGKSVYTAKSAPLLLLDQTGDSSLSNLNSNSNSNGSIQFSLKKSTSSRTFSSSNGSGSSLCSCSNTRLRKSLSNRAMITSKRSSSAGEAEWSAVQKPPRALRSMRRNHSLNLQRSKSVACLQVEALGALEESSSSLGGIMRLGLSSSKKGRLPSRKTKSLEGAAKDATKAAVAKALAARENEESSNKDTKPPNKKKNRRKSKTQHGKKQIPLGDYFASQSQSHHSSLGYGPTMDDDDSETSSISTSSSTRRGSTSMIRSSRKLMAVPKHRSSSMTHISFGGKRNQSYLPPNSLRSERSHPTADASKRKNQASGAMIGKTSGGQQKQLNKTSSSKSNLNNNNNADSINFSMKKSTSTQAFPSSSETCSNTRLRKSLSNQNLVPSKRGSSIGTAPVGNEAIPTVMQSMRRNRSFNHLPKSKSLEALAALEGNSSSLPSSSKKTSSSSRLPSRKVKSMEGAAKGATMAAVAKALADRDTSDGSDNNSRESQRNAQWTSQPKAPKDKLPGSITLVDYSRGIKQRSHNSLGYGPTMDDASETSVSSHMSTSSRRRSTSMISHSSDRQKLLGQVSHRSSSMTHISRSRSNHYLPPHTSIRSTRSDLLMDEESESSHTSSSSMIQRASSRQTLKQGSRKKLSCSNMKTLPPTSPGHQYLPANSFRSSNSDPTMSDSSTKSSNTGTSRRSRQQLKKSLSKRSLLSTGNPYSIRTFNSDPTMDESNTSISSHTSATSFHRPSYMIRHGSTRQLLTTGTTGSKRSLLSSPDQNMTIPGSSLKKSISDPSMDESNTSISSTSSNIRISRQSRQLSKKSSSRRSILSTGYPYSLRTSNSDPSMDESNTSISSHTSNASFRRSATTSLIRSTSSRLLGTSELFLSNAQRSCTTASSMRSSHSDPTMDGSTSSRSTAMDDSQQSTISMSSRRGSSIRRVGSGSGSNLFAGISKSEMYLSHAQKQKTPTRPQHQKQQQRCSNSTNTNAQWTSNKQKRSNSTVVTTTTNKNRAQQLSALNSLLPNNLRIDPHHSRAKNQATTAKSSSLLGRSAFMEDESEASLRLFSTRR